MIIETKPVTRELSDDLSILFCSHGSTNNYWCLWFIRSVKELHVGGGEGNRRSLLAIVESEKTPLGLLA